MLTLVLLISVLVILVTLLRFKFPLGPAIFLCGLFLWLTNNPTPGVLMEAAQKMLTRSRTYDLVAALYFVVCLEVELRKSGCLSGMVQCLQRLTSNKKAILAIMPAFLGLLPSVGGARFSAPIVKQVAQGEDLSPERLAGINFWFRHVFEFASPIVPGMMLSCAIMGVPVATAVCHLAWVTIAAFIIGWIVLMAPLKIKPSEPSAATSQTVTKERLDFALAFFPILVTLLLMMVFGLSAGVATGLSVSVTWCILKLTHRAVPLRDVFFESLELKLFRDVFCIFFFIELLETTGFMQDIVTLITSAPLSTGWIVGLLSFIAGVLTGLTPGAVAVAMPIAAAVAPAGSLDMLSIVLVCGVGGQMVTPTHMCLIISLDYFKSDFMKTLLPCVVCEAALVILFIASLTLF